MWNRIWALVMRYLFTYRRSWLRLVEVIFWPAVDLLIWGYVTVYLDQLNLSGAVTFLLGGVILWDVLFRAQQALALSILQEMWVGNLLNIFVAPLRTFEIVAAAALMGVLRAGVTVVTIGLLAWVLYAFNLLLLGLALIPFLAMLILFGWAIGILVTALIIRYGEAVETLAWAIPFLLQPFCAVFYPVTVFPEWLQVAAHFIPCTWVFEAMRGILANGPFSWSSLGISFLLNLVYLALASLFLMYVLKVARAEGYLTRTVRN